MSQVMDAAGVGSLPRGEAEGHLRLPFHPCSAAVARRQLRLWIARHLHEDEHAGGIADSAELIVSELVGNAIRHARPVLGGVLALRWRLEEDGLVISVTDGGSSGVPHKVDASLHAQSGRGMAIIDAVAERWWTDSSPTAATVSALVGSA